MANSVDPDQTAAALFAHAHLLQNVEFSQYEPHHEKTCLRGLWPVKTHSPAQLQRLARVLKFGL